MVVLLGEMQLPVTEDPDPVRTYLNGTAASGGLWTALGRSSDHDHSGGLNGKLLGAASIPDGSITTAKLDPSVLLPYALVDGSKPFTGQVTMQADAIIRDTLYFGEQGTALPPDAFWQRVAPDRLRTDANVGLGTQAPSALAPAFRMVQVYQGVALIGDNAGLGFLGGNTYYDGAGWKSLAAGAAVRGQLAAGAWRFDTAPTVGAANAAQTFTTRLEVAAAGTVTLTPEAGQPPLVALGSGADFVRTAAGQHTVLVRNTAAATGQDSAGVVVQSGPGPTVNALLAADANGGHLGLGAHLAVTTAHDLTFWTTNAARVRLTFDAKLQPVADNGAYLGFTGNRWVAVYAVNGAIQTSLVEAKQGITPLDPAACYQAAKDVRWYDFRYQPPPFVAPEPGPGTAYDEHDSNEAKAEKKALRDRAEAEALAAHARMLLETAPARHQRGFVFPVGVEAQDEAGGPLPPVPDLFGLDDRESTTPQADLATLGCALQEVIRRLEILEGTAA